MYGLEAISANNGWAMAATGAFIVISGLTLLSIVIAQLKKLVGVLEKREKELQGGEAPPNGEAKERQPAVAPDVSLPDVDEPEDLYRALTEQLDDPFQLRDLYEICRKNNLPHPHLTIRDLRSSRMLIPRGDGIFFWNR